MEGTATTSAPATTASPAPSGSQQAMTSTPAPVKIPAEGGKTPAQLPTRAGGASGTGADANGGAEEYIDVDGERVPKAELFKTFKNSRQIYKEAYSKFEESAKLRKEADSKLDKIKNPKDAIRFLADEKNGYKPDEVRAAFEEWYAEQYIAPEQMTAEQRRIAELEKKTREYESKEQERLEREKQEEEKKIDQTYMQQLQREIAETIESSGLEKTKFNANRIAHWIRVNEAKGISAPKDLVIQQVRNEFNGILKDAVKSTGGDAKKLIGILGEDVVKIIRKYDIEQLRLKRNGGAPPTETPNKDFNDPLTPPKEKISVDEVKRRARLFR